jgi:hypothetical protein
VTSIYIARSHPTSSTAEYTCSMVTMPSVPFLDAAPRIDGNLSHGSVRLQCVRALRALGGWRTLTEIVDWIGAPSCIRESTHRRLQELHAEGRVALRSVRGPNEAHLWRIK